MQIALISQGNKLRARCNQIRTLDWFVRDKNTKIGYKGACRKCLCEEKQRKRGQDGYVYVHKPISKSSKELDRLFLNGFTWCPGCQQEIPLKNMPCGGKRFSDNNGNRKKRMSPRCSPCLEKENSKPETKQRKREYSKTDKAKVSYRANLAKRRAAKLERTVSWADMDKIKEIYRLSPRDCTLSDDPDDHHVDHILPLQGETVSGFHVEYNLQYLPKRINSSKNNKADGHFSGFLFIPYMVDFEGKTKDDIPHSDEVYLRSPLKEEGLI